MKEDEKEERRGAIAEEMVVSPVVNDEVLFLKQCKMQPMLTQSQRQS